MIRVLYGTGKTRWREELAMRYLARHDIIVGHVPINWYSDEPFDSLLARMTDLTEKALQKYGKITLLGSSAGGSLAVNILGQISDKNLSTITLCSRLQLANLPWWDKRTLERMAGMSTLRPSQLFFDSVTYCSQVTIPRLSAANKKRIL